MKIVDKNRHNRLPYRGGFTLVEVMIVLFILVMLAGTVIVQVQGQRKRAQKQTALTYVKILASAVDRYDGDMGRPPTTEEGLRALIECPDVPNAGAWGGPYIKTDATSVDPWGNEYQYASPGKNRDFDIWSFGPDMMDGTSDDIGNWMNEI